MQISTERQRNLAIFFLLFLLPLIYFFPAVKGDVVLMYGDAWAYSLPMREFLGASLREGVLPMWNPHIFGGVPFLGAIQAGSLYPPNWLFALFSPGVALNAVVILTYHLALFGTWLFGRRVGMTRAGALASAVIFTFGGFLITQYDQTNYIAALVWLPWILLAIEHLYEGPSLRPSLFWIVLGAFFIALQTYAGLPQASFQTALIASPFTLFRLFSTADRRHARRFALAIALVVVVGLLFAAVQLLPARELQLQGDRAHISYEFFSEWSMPPRRLLSLVFPNFFGGGLGPLYHLAEWDSKYLVRWAHGYAGMTGLLLAFIGITSIFKRGRDHAHRSYRRDVIFWLSIALFAITLSFGSYLPFNLNQTLYNVPVLNLFRGSFRHLFEYSFAVSILAGLGLTALARLEKTPRRRIFVIGALLLLTLSLGTSAAFFSFGRKFLVSEALVPLLFCLLAIGAVCFFVIRNESPKEWQRLLAAGLVLLVLLLDLASFGYFTEWRAVGWNALETIADPPAVEFVKSREPDLKSFRVLDHSVGEYAADCAELNCQNMSIFRGLDTAGGYEPMRLARVAAMAGGMSILGRVRETSAFGIPDQSLNLLNVKYLFQEHADRVSDTTEFGLRFDGIPFKEKTIGLTLSPGESRELEVEVDGFEGTDLAIVSAMSDSASVPDASKVGQIVLHLKTGALVHFDILAGRDTSEWAWDRSDVRPIVRHARANVAESFDAEGFQAHRYLARFPLERANVESIEFRNVHSIARLVIERVSLFDSLTGKVMSPGNERLPSARWRKLAAFGRITVFENLECLPRAWFVSKVEAMPASEALQTIKTGRLRRAGGDVPFDPAMIALIESELEPFRDIGDSEPQGRVTPVSYTADRIELDTINDKAGFLVLSEAFYPGWKAFIDGTPATIHRTNYALRGLAIPEGTHRVVMRFRPQTFYTGLYCALGGVVLLVCCTAFRRKVAEGD